MKNEPGFRGAPLFVLCTAVALATFGACDCGGPGPGSDGGPDANVSPDASIDGGPDGGGLTDGGLTDGGLTDGGLTDGGLTDGGGGGGGYVSVFCAGTGASCISPVQCCSGECTGGTCSATACKATGTTCSAPTDCCSGSCTGSTCQAGTCRALYDSCSSPTDCCSTNCKSGQCQPASTCAANNDICYLDGDCCSLNCSTTTAGQPGRCVPPAGGCWVAGTPCTAGTANSCCTNLCLDPGSGVTVCAFASGCKVTGDACLDTLQCCGGVGTVAGGNVTCVAKDFTCGQGQSCNYPGSVCGKPQMILPDGGIACQPGADGGGCMTVPVNANCCFASGNFKADATCRLDSTGIPRCFGGGNVPGCIYGYDGQPGCCIAAGDTCAFSGQCCNGVPCVPDDAGMPRCTVPQCISLGAGCTPGGTGASACCSGDCLAVSELSYACQIVRPPPDGGVADAGTACLPNGLGCSTGSQCCSQICTGGSCVAPTSCQPQGGVCQSSSNCCTGYTCQVAPGSTSGTCQTGGQTCGSAGQSCSPSNLCCGEGSTLECDTAAGVVCDGTSACTCQYIIVKIQPTWP